MQKWEYYVPHIVSSEPKMENGCTVMVDKVNVKKLRTPLTLKQFLNRLGENGWEYVEVLSTNTVNGYIFKRLKL